MMQRAGNTHRAAMGDSNHMMKLKDFMKTCADVLDDNGDGNSAFWFSQIAEHLADGGELTVDKKEVSRILGL